MKNLELRRKLPVVSGLILLLLVSAMACGGSEDAEDDASGQNSNLSPTTASERSGSSSSDSDDRGAVQPSIDEACGPLDSLLGFSFALGGFSKSSNPDSDLARAVSDFFDSAIDEAISEAEPACFVELTIEDDSGFWMVFELSEQAPADAADRLRDHLVATGVDSDNVVTFSSTGATGLGAFSGLAVTGLPEFGNFRDSGFSLQILGDAVIVIGGSDSTSGENPLTDPGEDQDGPGVTETATSGISTTGLIDTLDAQLRAELEKILGVSLELTSSFSAGEGSSVLASLTYSASSAPAGDLDDRLSEAASSIGASVDFTTTFGDAASVGFSGGSIGGLNVDGSFSVTADIVVLTLQVTE